MSRAGSTPPSICSHQRPAPDRFLGTRHPGFQEFHDRWRGYCRALRAAGIEPDDALQVDARTERTGRAATRSRNSANAASSSTPSSRPATLPRSAPCTRCKGLGADSATKSQSSASTTFPPPVFQARRSAPSVRTQKSRRDLGRSRGGSGRVRQCSDAASAGETRRPGIQPLRLTRANCPTAFVLPACARAHEGEPACSPVAKPRQSLAGLWNISFGFFGIQIGFALQNANMSRIFQSLGSSLDDFPPCGSRRR